MSGARAVVVLYAHVTQCHIIDNHLLLGRFLNFYLPLMECEGDRYETVDNCHLNGSVGARGIHLLKTALPLLSTFTLCIALITW